MDETISRILSLIKASGLTDKQILKELDASTSSTLITDWRTGRSKSPQIRHIKKLAELFDVSIDYLVTGTDKKTALSADEQTWLNLYKELSNDSQECKQECIGFVKGYIARGKSISLKGDTTG